MKRRILTLLALALLLLPVCALADKARFLIRDGNRTYHSQHLVLHTGSANCRVSGNYITVRSGKGSGSTLGHVEQADAFRLDEVSGNYARITVTYAAPTSPKSYVGLSGWVNADYVECPCSRDEYYYNSARRTYDLGTVVSGGAQLKETASSKGRSLSKIGAGETVEILAEYDGGWYRVRWGRRMGFVASGKVTVTARGIPEGGGTAPVPAVTGWREGYRDFLTLNHAAYGPAAVWDMDRDGTPELILHNGDDSMAGAFCYVFTWNGSAAVCIGEIGWRECTLAYYPGSAYPGLFCTDGNMGVYTTRYYAKSGYSVSSRDVMEEDHTRGGATDWDETPVYTSLTGDYDLYYLARYQTPVTLRMRTYGEITSIGWDAFLR